MSDTQQELRLALAKLERQRAELTQVIATLRQRLGNDADLVPLKIAAAETGYSGETLRLWVTKGVVAATRIGGRWLVDQHSLEEHLRQRTATLS